MCVVELVDSLDLFSEVRGRQGVGRQGEKLGAGAVPAVSNVANRSQGKGRQRALTCSCIANV